MNNLDNIIQDLTGLQAFRTALKTQRFDGVTDLEKYITSFLISICKEHIPNTEIKIYPRDKPWMTLAVKKAIKK